MCLDFCRPLGGVSTPSAFCMLSTPLMFSAWDRALQAHPDRAFARYILRGIQHGFRIGFNRTSPLKSAKQNMQSALIHHDVIRQYLSKECSLGRMLGPFTGDSLLSLLPLCHVNRFGVIPKGHNTGKWRLITDLSFPPGGSVNDGIDPTLCSLAYTSVDQVAEVVAQYGRGSLLAKIDIESAYRLVPVHPDDRPMQAMVWEGNLYIDPMLPFGLRSAPKIFNAVADALEWYLHYQGVTHVFHYLDDFIVVGPPDSPSCGQDMALLNHTCKHLGVPIAEHKRDGPTTCITFLGIEIDTIKGHLRLPADKLSRLQTLLEEWGDRKSCQRRELESLIGLLNHACKVVRSGRAFLRRMIDLLHGVPAHPQRPHPIRLNTEFRSDLVWWRTFAAEWNGISFLPPPQYLPALHMASDASGSWGCGAWHGTKWFQLRWESEMEPLSIMVKELIPIVLACAIWGPTWKNHAVLCYCDNQAVVACIKSKTTKNKHCMHMLRTLAFIEAHHHFHLRPLYINTRLNHIADDLSRDNLHSFFTKVPQACREPESFPLPLLRILLDLEADWISPHWHQQFSAIFKPGLHNPPRGHTGQH